MKIIKFALKEGLNTIKHDHPIKEVLTVKFQRGIPTVWIMTDSKCNAHVSPIDIYLARTGEELDWDDYKTPEFKTHKSIQYLGTLEAHHLKDDDYVLHAFLLP